VIYRQIFAVIVRRRRAAGGVGEQGRRSGSDVQRNERQRPVGPAASGREEARGAIFVSI